MPQDKAPGPGGFTGHFFKTSWHLICNDVMVAVDSLFNLRNNDLNLLNKANVILIPKKKGAESIGDFRLISLIHGFAKLITKVLALRLAPLINELISPCQSAFIKNHPRQLPIRSEPHAKIPPSENSRPATQIRHLQGLRLRTL
jgi:hypothetical protein